MPAPFPPQRGGQETGDSHLGVTDLELRLLSDGGALTGCLGGSAGWSGLRANSGDLWATVEGGGSLVAPSTQGGPHRPAPLGHPPAHRVDLLGAQGTGPGGPVTWPRAGRGCYGSGPFPPCSSAGRVTEPQQRSVSGAAQAPRRAGRAGARAAQARVGWPPARLSRTPAAVLTHSSPPNAPATRPTNAPPSNQSPSLARPAAAVEDVRLSCVVRFGWPTGHERVAGQARLAGLSPTPTRSCRAAWT
jgi:hypothetical protein